MDFGREFITGGVLGQDIEDGVIPSAQASS